MVSITLSLEEGTVSEMEHFSWVNWSSIARHAFSETLNDVKELELKKKIHEISEISKDDKREVKEFVVKEVVKSIEEISKKLKSGKIKPMTLDELDKLMGLK